MPIQSDIIQPFPKGIAMIEFFLIDILFLFFAILLIVKRNTVFGKDYDVLSLNCSLKIRGALAILIVLHHLSLTIRYTILFKVFTLIGAPCVAIFFFYSGFAPLLCGARNNGDRPENSNHFHIRLGERRVLEA